MWGVSARRRGGGGASRRPARRGKYEYIRMELCSLGDAECYMRSERCVCVRGEGAVCVCVCVCVCVWS